MSFNLSAPLAPTNNSLEAYRIYAKLYTSYQNACLAKYTPIQPDPLLVLRGGAAQTSRRSSQKAKPIPVSKRANHTPTPPSPDCNTKPVTLPSCRICKRTFSSRNLLFKHLPGCRINKHQKHQIDKNDEPYRKQLMAEHSLTTTQSYTAVETRKFFELLKKKPLRNHQVSGLTQLSLSRSGQETERKLYNNLTRITGGYHDVLLTSKEDIGDLAEFMKDCPIYNPDGVEPLTTVTLGADDIPEELCSTGNYSQKDVFNSADPPIPVFTPPVHLSSNLPKQQSREDVQYPHQGKERKTFISLNNYLSQEPEVVADERTTFLPPISPSAFPTNSNSRHGRRESIFSRTGDDELFDSE